MLTQIALPGSRDYWNKARVAADESRPKKVFPNFAAKLVCWTTGPQAKGPRDRHPLPMRWAGKVIGPDGVDSASGQASRAPEETGVPIRTGFSITFLYKRDVCPDGLTV